MWEKNVWNWCVIIFGFGIWFDFEIFFIMLISFIGYIIGFVRFFWKSVLLCIEGVVFFFMVYKIGDKRIIFIC